MAKQFVTEIHKATSVVILINGVDAKIYNRNPVAFEGYNNPLLDGVSEYTEITEGNKVHYWIWVPDLITNNSEKIKSSILSYKERKALEKKELIRRKNERIARYRLCIENNVEITPTAEDLEDGLKLEKMKKRIPNNKINKLKNTIVSMLNPAVYEDDYFPDEDVGISKKLLKINPYNEVILSKK